MVLSCEVSLRSIQTVHEVTLRRDLVGYPVLRQLSLPQERRLPSLGKGHFTSIDMDVYPIPKLMSLLFLITTEVPGLFPLLILLS